MKIIEYCKTVRGFDEDGATTRKDEPAQSDTSRLPPGRKTIPHDQQREADMPVAALSWSFLCRTINSRHNDGLPCSL